jgi:serine/threonine protein phosphatase PrpC
LSWRLASASVRGTAHARTGAACEDYHVARLIDTPTGALAVLALADGAGSAAAAQYGARVAVESAVASVAAGARRLGAEGLDAGTLVEALADARAGVFVAVDAFGGAPADYASTLLLVVALAERTLCAHVGDGGIVVDDGELRALSFPQQGEYANATRLLIDDDALDAARLIEWGTAHRIALFSDGLQALALDYATHSAFAPFFDPLFAHVETNGAAAADLCEQLEGWLGSAAVNERTDDDKTLILSVHAP